MDGILNLNKPKGWTSHDVVAHIRRLTGIRRVGHAGTLDPMATGVLLICLGKATRIAEYLMAGQKRYLATLRLGISTDSHDADGRVVAEAPLTTDYVEAEIESAMSRFRGRIDQVPPMVSAIKRNGQPLYKLARRGITIERPARPVEIYELNLVNWLSPDLIVDLTCSAGTYVRALARDLGQDLGCGAHLTALTRLASGDFLLRDAVEIDELDAAVKGDRVRHSPDRAYTSDGNHAPAWHHLVMPIDTGLNHFPAHTLREQESWRVRNGQSLPAESIPTSKDTLCRAYVDSAEGEKLLALLRFDDDAQVWRPKKVFSPE